jgi:hypothetical protein
MAKIEISFDTKSKELSISKDGQALANVESVMICKNGGYYGEGGDDYCFSAMTLDKYDDDGYKQYTQISASLDGGTVSRKVNKLTESLARYYKSLKGK